MKKNIFYLTFITLFFFYNLAQAQCDVAIPTNAITGSADLSSGSNIRWVCNNEIVSSTIGGSNTFFIEEGAIVNSTDGGSHIIYVKNGGTLNIDGSGGSISVYFEPNAIINNNLVGGGNNIFTPCATIVFDYTNAPSAPCNPILGIDELKLKEKVKIFPNPSSKFIQVSGLIENENYRIYNILGTEIKSGIISNNVPIDIREFINGLYFFKFNNGNTMLFVKE